jgi:Reverse transcriptase (RNA-dependent DNA polymerase)
MLRVVSDFLTAADVRKITLLGLLDMSAAFDCVDHVTLLRRLDLGFGLTDDVIKWIRSFLTGRTQQVADNGALSTTQPVFFCIPQGYVLGPIFYVLNIAELESIVDRPEMKLHQYADDSHIYVSVPVSDVSVAADRFSACLADVNRWLSSSRLRLNPSKTQVMWLSSRQQLQQVDIISEISVVTTVVRITEVARDLGVMIDSRFSSATSTAPSRRLVAGGRHQNARSCVCIVPRGLLSFSTVWHC